MKKLICQSTRSAGAAILNLNSDVSGSDKDAMAKLTELATALNELISNLIPANSNNKSSASFFAKQTRPNNGDVLLSSPTMRLKTTS